MRPYLTDNEYHLFREQLGKDADQKPELFEGDPEVVEARAKLEAATAAAIEKPSRTSTSRVGKATKALENAIKDAPSVAVRRIDEALNAWPHILDEYAGHTELHRWLIRGHLAVATLEDAYGALRVYLPDYSFETTSNDLILKALEHLRNNIPASGMTNELFTAQLKILLGQNLTNQDVRHLVSQHFPPAAHPAMPEERLREALQYLQDNDPLCWRDKGALTIGLMEILGCRRSIYRLAQRVLAQYFTPVSLLPVPGERLLVAIERLRSKGPVSWGARKSLIAELRPVLWPEPPALELIVEHKSQRTVRCAA